MKTPYRTAILYTFFIAVSLALIGCSSSNSPRFYLLSPLPEGSNLQQTVAGPCINLVVGPVRLPEYLDRPQIVTRTTRNELEFAPYDRWAEPLSDTFLRVVAEDLSQLMCTRTISLYPSRLPVVPDYRVEIQVIRMDGKPGGEAVLEAWWSVSGNPAKKIFVTKRSRFTEPSRGDDYAAFVSAHDRTVASLCREIAQVITKVTRENPPPATVMD
ncbi:MAG: PqiC family protein [Syntrophorhabdaceae bacterium]